MGESLSEHQRETKGYKMVNIIRKIIVKIFPLIVYDEKTSLKAIKNLNEKLQGQKRESKYWRDRVLKTEQFLCQHKKNGEELAREFDSKYDTNLTFKILL